MSDFFETRPQKYCLMCGKCCKVVTTVKSYEELVKLAEKGDKFSKDFLKIFEPYESIQAARKVSAEIVDNIIKKFETAINAPKKLTLYKCKFISDNNLCKIYNKKPILCTRFPSSPWAVVPPGCGFEGWLFQKREEIKQKIRYQKECLIEFETLIKTIDNPETIEKLKKQIKKIKKTIKLFADYGSDNW